MAADDQNETKVTKERKTPREAAIEAAQQLKTLGAALPEECAGLYEEACAIYKQELEKIETNEIPSFKRAAHEEQLNALKEALIHVECFNVGLFGGEFFSRNLLSCRPCLRQIQREARQHCRRLTSTRS
jgi:hypothetical protein